MCIRDRPGPDVLLGINTQFSFGALSLGLAAHGMLGNYAYNNYASNAGVLRAAQNPLLFTSNISADYLNTRFVNNQYLSDYYISNASFLRLDNINIGYNLSLIHI